MLANGFTDDVALLITGTDPNSMVDIMHVALDMAMEWGGTKWATFWGREDSSCLVYP